ncbi:MAG: YafY family protein [Gammaproteobacteria bacterium]|nr:YafY family protein [Gammaproteobacteria bacterium]
MDRTERFYIIDQLLNGSRSVSRAQFLEALEISAATFKRDLEYLRDRLGAPIVWDRELRGYRYQQDAEHAQNYQLPGLWFNTGEIQALLTMHAWLENLQPGILSEHIKPLQARIRALLDQGDHSVDEITRRIRILTQPRKSAGNSYFQQISQALLNRKRLRIEHFNRASNQRSQREVSPQRLTFYRDNWYLDSWCHQRHAIRSFAVDALQGAEILTTPAREVDEALLHQELASGYGIFSGRETHWAELRFTPERARWVAQEQWHPQQRAHFDAEGFYHLAVPFSQEPELLMEILKHGAEVEVLAPPGLRQRMKQTLAAMSENYGTGS